MERAVTEWTSEADGRPNLVRYADLVPCRTGFHRHAHAGFDRQGEFHHHRRRASRKIPDQFVHITEPHGFNIGGARQPKGCTNSQHSHETAEVFVVHSGHWRLIFGPEWRGWLRSISPPAMSCRHRRGCFAALKRSTRAPASCGSCWDSDDPGKVTWAPAVLEAAADFGLKLAKGGLLIDTSFGRLRIARCRAGKGRFRSRCGGRTGHPAARAIAAMRGTRAGEAPRPTRPRRWPARGRRAEAGMIVPVATADGFASRADLAAGGPHGFNLRQLTLQSGAYVPLHSRAEARGDLHPVRNAGGQLGRRQPDHGRPATRLSVPVSLPRAFRNTASMPCVAVVVRGSEDPAMPVFG